ncbi:hypothetical protein A2U01_0054247, partial [Trifolium medium]|nr:hypothetical protein [Trifolium medium]
MPILAAEVEIVLAANIETDNIIAAKSVSAVPVQSPIPDMTATTPQPEADNNQYNDEHVKENVYTVFAGQQEKVLDCSDWSDDSKDVPETQV